MRLKKAQKEAVLAWVAEGLESDEINERAAKFQPPFSVLRSQVAHYRASRAVELVAMTRSGEYAALSEGLALREERVGRLQKLAALMEKDLFGGFLWLDDVKTVGGGPLAEIVDFEKFNAAEIDAYRGILDDIAKEVGQRSVKIEVYDWRKDAAEHGFDPDKIKRKVESELAQEQFAELVTKAGDDSHGNS